MRALQHIFVYGTLRVNTGHPLSQRLRVYARCCGRAFCRGRLYRIDWYPGMVTTSAPGEYVIGELFASVPPALLHILDRYEEYDPNHPQKSEFIRLVQPVYLRTGLTVMSWVYLYNRSIAGKERIASGDFLDMLKDSPRGWSGGNAPIAASSIF